MCTSVAARQPMVDADPTCGEPLSQQCSAVSAYGPCECEKKERPREGQWSRTT